MIAGLARVVLVAEAATRSGSLITARLAQKMGRVVLARPGSSGNDLLLRSGGAYPVKTPEAVVDAMRRAPVERPGEFSFSVHGPDGLPRADPNHNAGPRLGRLLAVLEERPLAPDEIALKTKMPLQEVLALLTEAELDGCLRRQPGDKFEVNRVS